MGSTQELSPQALASLVDASAAINAARELDETLSAIARAAAAVMRAEASSVIMVDRARGKQIFRAAVGDRAEQILGVEFDADVGVCGKVLRTGRAEIVDDVAHSTTHFKEIDVLVGFHTRSILAAPLVSKGERLGVVEVINAVGGGSFAPSDLQLAQVFANLAAIAVANSQLRDRLRRDARGLKADAARTDGEMVGRSAAIAEVKDLVARVGDSNATVLLLGETGTGKELAARLVHACSPRAERPFIAVNCAALPTTLMESELFGHEAGAFTGATARKLGRFELADGGTIFLDEVAEISGEVQVKLLRVLQERQIVRVGGTRSIGCDVRVVAATNRDLGEEMQAGRFREDLFYRLNVFPIRIPPLRERRDDIPLLVECFLSRLAGELKMPPPRISAVALTALGVYEYPGNIRQLQNILERACLLCRGGEGEGGRAEIGVEHLPEEVLCDGAGAAAAAGGGSALQAGEKAMILRTLRACGWNQSKAARSLGISRDNIRYRMRKYNISRPT